MDRRSFLKSVAVTGASAALMKSAPRITAEDDVKSPSSHIIVNGLDPSIPSEEYLDMLKKAGVGWLP